MKTADQIAQEIQPHIEANNGQIGETNRRLALIGDGAGNAQPSTLLTPRDVFYRSSLDQNDRGVAVLSPKCPIPIQAINGYYNTEVWIGNLPGSSQVMILDLADTAGYSTGGPTPLEGLANAGSKPSQDQLLILRLAPPDDAGMSVFIDTGQIAAVAYEVGDGTMGFVGSTNLDLSDPTNGIIWVPVSTDLASGEHRIVGIALDPTSGQFIAIAGAAVSTSNTLPSAASRSEFGEADYQAIDFTGYYPAGYVYNYYGQTTPVEDDIMRQFDPRLFMKPMGSGGGTGTVTSVTAGTGLDATPNPIVATGTINLADTAVTPGSYTSADITVDQQGRITAASNGSAGDVVGPASAVNNDLAAFDGTTGKLIKDSGLLTANVAKAVAALADKFLLQTADATNLPNAQAMGALATGLVKNTTTTGVQSIAAAGTDYTSPTGTENLSNKTITASSLVATALSLLIGGFKAIFTHSNTADRTYTLRDETGTLQMQRLTTKGDLLTYDTSDVRLGVGSDNTVLTADSGQAKGVKWALVSLVNSVTGILGLANGGTGAALNATGPGVPVQATSGAVFSILRALSIGYLADGNRLACKYGSNSNITISAPGGTIDGASPSNGDRILLFNQTAPAENGPWIYNGSAVAMTRPDDYPSGSTVHAFYGVRYKILAGSTLAGDEFYIATTGTITIDTTSTTWNSSPLNALQLFNNVNVNRGGTGVNSLTANNLLVGNGASLTFLAPGASGTVVHSDGTFWSAQALVAADIPNLPGSIITSGTVAAAQLGTMTGASFSGAGASGAAPSPATKDNTKVLSGAATYIRAMLTQYSQGADVTVASPTTTETTLIGTGLGSVTFAANALNEVGRSFEIRAVGYATRAAGNTTIKIKVGGTTIFTFGPSATAWGTNNRFEIYAKFTAKSTGSTGTIAGQAYVDTFTAINAFVRNALVGTGTTTLDLTGTLAVDVTWQWSNNTGQSVTCTNLDIIQIAG